MTGGPVRIEVATERSYPVLVGRGMRDQLPATVAGLDASAAVLLEKVYAAAVGASM